MYHKISKYLFRLLLGTQHDSLKVACSDLFCLPPYFVKNVPTQSGRTAISWLAKGCFFFWSSLLNTITLFTRQHTCQYHRRTCWNFNRKGEILRKVFFLHEKGELFFQYWCWKSTILNHQFYMNLSAIDKMEDPSSSAANTTPKKFFMHGSVLFSIRQQHLKHGGKKTLASLFNIVV